MKSVLIFPLLVAVMLNSCLGKKFEMKTHKLAAKVYALTQATLKGVPVTYIDMKGKEILKEIEKMDHAISAVLSPKNKGNFAKKMYKKTKKALYRSLPSAKNQAANLVGLMFTKGYASIQGAKTDLTFEILERLSKRLHKMSVTDNNKNSVMELLANTEAIKGLIKQIIMTDKDMTKHAGRQADPEIQKRYWRGGWNVGLGGLSYTRGNHRFGASYNPFSGRASFSYSYRWG